MKASIGRADLLMLLLAGHPGEKAARALGAVDRGRRTETEVVPGSEVVTKKGAEPRDPIPLPPASEAPRPTARFWRATQWRDLDAEERAVGESSENAPYRPDQIPKLAPPPRPAPLLNRGARRRLLESILRFAEPSRTPDDAALLRRFVRGEALSRIPVRNLRRWPPKIRLVLDRRSGLIPIWQDHDDLVRDLQSLLGKHRIEESRGIEGLGEAVAALGPEAASHDVLYLGAADSDGALSSMDAAAVDRGSRPRRHIAVMAGAAVRHRSWRGKFQAVTRFDDTRQTVPRMATESAIREIENFAAVAGEVNPHDLRAWRRLGSESGAGLGIELAVWSRLEVPLATGGILATGPRLEALRRLRADSSLQTRILDQVRRRRPVTDAEMTRGLPPELESELLATAIGANAGEAPADSMLATADQISKPLLDGRLSRRSRNALACYLIHILNVVLSLSGSSSRFGQALLKLDRQARAVLSPGSRELRSHRIMASYGKLQIWSENPAHGATGFRTVDEIDTHSDCLRVFPEGVEVPIEIDSGDLEAKLPPDCHRCEVASDRELVAVERFERPPYASAVGTDNRGLWLEVGERFERVRFWWHSGRTERGEETRAEGRWVLDQGTAPRWIHEAGIDQFGAWANIVVNGGHERLRWIPPGIFEMGVPGSVKPPENLQSLGQPTVHAGFWMGRANYENFAWNNEFYDSSTRMLETRMINKAQASRVDRLHRRLAERVSSLRLRLPAWREWALSRHLDMGNELESRETRLSHFNHQMDSGFGEALHREVLQMNLFSSWRFLSARLHHGDFGSIELVLCSDAVIVRPIGLRAVTGVRTAWDILAVIPSVSDQELVYVVNSIALRAFSRGLHVDFNVSACYGRSFFTVKDDVPAKAQE